MIATEIHEHVGFVAPYLELYEEITALENLRIEAKARGLKWKGDDKLHEILELVGLFSRRNDELRSFSSGMKQRLKYAAALIHEPDMMVLDEPTANLNIAGTDMVFALVDKLRKDKIVVVATNDEKENSSWRRESCAEKGSSLLESILLTRTRIFSPQRREVADNQKDSNILGTFR